MNTNTVKTTLTMPTGRIYSCLDIYGFIPNRICIIAMDVDIVRNTAKKPKYIKNISSP